MSRTSKQYRSSAAKRVKPGMSGRRYGGSGLQGPRPEKGPSKAQAAVEESLQALLEMFESGEMPAAVARTMIARLEGLAPSANWSLGNQLILLRNGTSDARGYRQWQEVGRHVVKGSRALYILAPNTRKVTDRDKATGEESARTIVTGFRGLPVFAYEDTEGAPIEREQYDPPALPPLHEVARALGVDVQYAPNVGGNYAGFYDPNHERIMLVTHDEKTFWHELAHAAHRRVLQSRGADLKGGQVASQEIVAETVAATLCVLYGREGYVYEGAAYVKGYATAADVTPARAAIRCLADIQATLYLIVETAVSQGAYVPETAPERAECADCGGPFTRDPDPASPDHGRCGDCADAAVLGAAVAA